jgi:protease I
VGLEPCGTAALLRSLAVVPEHRNEGVGGRLVDAVEAAGGTYADIEMTEAVTDGNLVTAPVWPAHAAWIREFLEVLGTRIEHAEPVTA